MLSMLSLLLLIPVAASSSASCKSEEGACASSDDHDEDIFLQLGDVRSHVQSSQFSAAQPVMPYPFGAYDLSMVDVSMPPPPPAAAAYPCVTQAIQDNFQGTVDCEAGNVQNTTCWQELEGKMGTILKTCCVNGTDTAAKEKAMCDQMKINRDAVERTLHGLKLQAENGKLQAENASCMKKAMPELKDIQSDMESYASSCDAAVKKKIVDGLEKTFSQGSESCKKMGDDQLKYFNDSQYVMTCCFKGEGVSMGGAPDEAGKEAAVKKLEAAVPKCCSNASGEGESFCGGIKHCLDNPAQCGM